MAVSIPLRSRKLDFAYFCFFCWHVPIMLFMDLVPVYPQWLVPAFLKANYQWYLSTFNDQLMATAPPWFRSFGMIELLYQLPFGFWVLGALKRDDPRVPVHLLIFSVVVVVTTLPCLAEFWVHPALSDKEKAVLFSFYSPHVDWIGYDLSDSEEIGYQYGREETVVGVLKDKIRGPGVSYQIRPYQLLRKFRYLNSYLTSKHMHAPDAVTIR